MAENTSVRVVVLSGAGGPLSVGADLDQFTEAPLAKRDEDEQVAHLIKTSRASLLLREMPQVTLAGIDGACAGAGMGLAMAADLRMITPRAIFKTAFVHAGMSGDFGLAWTLSNLVGDGVARRLLLEDPRIDATLAMELGLATRLTDESSFAADLAQWADGFAGLPPFAVAGIKQNLADAGLPFSEALIAESPLHIRCARSDDAQEAAQAFLERRQGRFIGR